MQNYSIRAWVHQGAHSVNALLHAQTNGPTPQSIHKCMGFLNLIIRTSYDYVLPPLVWTIQIKKFCDCYGGH